MDMVDKRFKELRIEYINKWPNCELFKAEKEYLQRYRKCNVQFKPYCYEFNENRDYNILVSNVMDALDNMPARPDLAFEFYWKALDNFLFTVSESTKTNKTQLQALIKYLSKCAQENKNVEQLFNLYFRCVPEKTVKYIYRKLFQEYNSNIIIDKIEKTTRQLHLRLYDYEKSTNNSNIKSIIHFISNEYGYKPDVDYMRVRNGWRFFQKLLSGETIEKDKNGKKIASKSFSFEERMNIFINGILYTFRNERFHGKLISPFRTSKTRFETYSHPTYCLVLVDFILGLLLAKSGYSKISEIVSCSENNLAYYNEMFNNKSNKK